jgi:hypothetical protein
MSATKRLIVIPIILLAITVFAQQPKPTSAVATVEVKASVTEAEVGQPTKDSFTSTTSNSGLWVVKLGAKIDKGSTTAPGQ